MNLNRIIINQSYWEGLMTKQISTIQTRDRIKQRLMECLEQILVDENLVVDSMVRPILVPTDESLESTKINIVWSVWIRRD